MASMKIKYKEGDRNILNMNNWVRGQEMEFDINGFTLVHGLIV